MSGGSTTKFEVRGAVVYADDASLVVHVL